MPRPLIPERRSKILDAAEALVLARGFDAMSIQSVADAVGIAKGSVYREFATKNALLEDLLERSMTRMNAAAAARLGDNPHPPLSLAYQVGMEILLDDPLMTAAFLDDRGILGSFAASVQDNRYAQRHRGLVKWIEDLQRSAQLAADVPAEGLALALSSTTIGLLTASRLLGPLDADQLRSAITAIGELIARGLEPHPAEAPAHSDRLSEPE